MATDAARWKSLCDFVINGTSTAAQQNRLGLALARREFKGDQYLAMTTAEKLRFAVSRGRAYFIDAVKDTEGQQGRQASDAAVQSSVDTELAEQP